MSKKSKPRPRRQPVKPTSTPATDSAIPDSLKWLIEGHFSTAAQRGDPVTFKFIDGAQPGSVVLVINFGRKD